MQNFDPEDDKKSPTKVIRKLRRYAKLMPCFVSTFYMLPSFLLAGQFSDNIWKDVPLFDTIDLLIVDEAGQALPEVSSVAFSLTKKALIVGDTDQIEPVWSIPAAVDRSNLIAYHLLQSESDYDNFWLQSGLLASSGNLMAVAQRQCNYHQFPKLQRGLYLTEHRRCYDSIISYCNDLIYEGILEPLRGSPKIPTPWATMLMISVDSESKSYGGSRGNPNEATCIAQWVKDNKRKILEYARQCAPKNNNLDDDTVLLNALGIITPFTKQAVLIKKSLADVGIPCNITVGTVHSLQGAERLIVLFSSVYGSNDKAGQKFYDRGGNMLNVAVSRAKDVFIVFGHADIFGCGDKSSPSGQLRSKLSN